MNHMPFVRSRARSAMAWLRRSTRPSYLVAALLAVSALVSALSARAAAANADQRCFTETGFCITGRIRTFWEHNGGLMVFGMPVGPEHESMIEGRVLQVQLFERTRLELHPENRAPYDVELGRMGEEVLAQQGRDWRAFAQSDHAPAGCMFFSQTSHSLCEPFLSYWRGQGLEFDGRRGTSEAESLALFGQPLSDPQVETNSSGDTVLTQWFERARFERHERHPISQEPLPRDRQVLLGLLGDEAGEHGEHGEPTARPTEPPHSEPTARPHEEPTARPTEPPHSEPTARPCEHERDGCHHDEPTARPTERPHEPTARPTERPHEPTARPTERPHEPTARPTERPHEPTATPRH